jgi:hypothetical protein
MPLDTAASAAGAPSGLMVRSGPSSRGSRTTVSAPMEAS